MDTLAEQLAAARKAAGMTQEELASAVHVARNSISSWEHGHRRPDVDMLRQLSQVLQYDFLSGEPKAPAEAVQTAPQAADEAQPPGIDNILHLGGVKPAHRGQKFLLICAAVLIVLALVLLLMPALRSTGAGRVSDGEGNTYSPADFQQTAPREAGQAHLTIDTIGETMQGDNAVHWMYTFVLREDNGVDFHMNQLEQVWLMRNSARHFVYSEKDLAIADVGPDLPAWKKVTITGGMPKNQPDMVGVGCRVTGHDASGAALTFTAYIPFPQD